MAFTLHSGYIHDTSIYKVLRQSVSLSVSLSRFVCPPGDKQIVCPPGTNISYTQERGGQTFPTHTEGGGDKQIVCPPGTNIFLSQVKIGPLLLEVSVAQW